MKIYAVFIFIFSLNVVYSTETHADPKLTSIVTDLINQTIAKVVAKLPDPVKIPEVALDFNKLNIKLVKGYINVTNLSIVGLKSLVTTAIDVDISKSHVHFIFVNPKLSIDMNYCSDILIANILPIYGQGTKSLVLNQLTIEISTTYTLGKTLQLSNLVIKITIGELQFEITGALDNADFSALLSRFVSEIGTKLINAKADAISNIISSIVEKIINSALSKQTIDYSGRNDIGDAKMDDGLGLNYLWWKEQ